MANLSATYAQVKRLRASGDCAGAISALRSAQPASDDDAFEAVVCLFVCGARSCISDWNENRRVNVPLLYGKALSVY